MFCRTTDRRLTDLAIHLTRIAIRLLRRAPSGWRAAKPAPEGTRNRFRGAEADRQRDVQHGGAQCMRLAYTKRLSSKGMRLPLDQIVRDYADLTNLPPQPGQFTASKDANDPQRAHVTVRSALAL